MRCCVVACVALAVMGAGCGGSSAMHGRALSRAPSRETVAAATHFLSRYVTADGRVIRHDQGGDIVSEGQAYGMLIAEVAARPTLVRAIWRWTAAHLRREDGLLAFHATGTGHVLDSQSATDADVLAAYALLRYRGPDADQMTQAGKDLAETVLAVESVPVSGAPVLVAGPWAKTSQPPVVNPSYWMPSVFAAIGRYTGDGRWSAAAGAATRLLAAVTRNGTTLPPDWGNVAAGRLVATGAPDGSAPVQYGLDAARLPIWYAASCDAEDQDLAAAWWTHALSRDDRSSALALTLTGSVISGTTNPVPLLAGSAAASAAGDQRMAAALAERAAKQSQRAPTYYGDAWTALAGALADGSLASCSAGG